MLHDPGSPVTHPRYTEIALQPRERDVLRRLAAELAGAAASRLHRQAAGLWCALNDLRSERPMVWITEIPWHEMNVGDELTLLTAHPWAREMETAFRRALYQWRHLPADMVLDDFLECPLAIHSTDFGIVEDVDVARTDEANDIVSRHFKVQIREPEDLEKIRMPVVTHDHATTEVIHATMEGLFADIMPVRLSGQAHIWCAPWDYLVRWWGVEEVMVDMIQRPEMVNAAVDRMVDAWMVELDQFVEQDLLSLDDRNIRIGSGGYGYTRDLPDPGSRLPSVSPADMWGCSNAQVFAGVSPDMHWEFALRHDLRWLERWGLTYYGCCEPLDRKIDLLRRIPNLRKISMSSWSDFESLIRQVGADYVISYKPSPAIFAEEVWRPEKARAALVRVLELTQRRCHLEIIMADISTVRYDPRRLWDWARIASETVARYA
jgi:hypothetical protein